MSDTAEQLLANMRRMMVLALAMDEGGNQIGLTDEEYTALISDLDLDELRITLYVVAAKFARFIRLSAVEDGIDPAEGIARLFEE